MPFARATPANKKPPGKGGFQSRSGVNSEIAL
jgi:hypothetical protein